MMRTISKLLLGFKREFLVLGILAFCMTADAAEPSASQNSMGQVDQGQLENDPIPDTTTVQPEVDPTTPGIAHPPLNALNQIEPISLNRINLEDAAFYADHQPLNELASAWKKGSNGHKVFLIVQAAFDNAGGWLGLPQYSIPHFLHLKGLLETIYQKSPKFRTYIEEIDKSKSLWSHLKNDLTTGYLQTQKLLILANYFGPDLRKIGREVRIKKEEEIAKSLTQIKENTANFAQAQSYEFNVKKLKEDLEKIALNPTKAKGEEASPLRKYFIKIGKNYNTFKDNLTREIKGVPRKTVLTKDELFVLNGYFNAKARNLELIELEQTLLKRLDNHSTPFSLNLDFHTYMILLNLPNKKFQEFSHLSDTRWKEIADLQAAYSEKRHLNPDERNLLKDFIKNRSNEYSYSLEEDLPKKKFKGEPSASAPLCNAPEANLQPTFSDLLQSYRTMLLEHPLEEQLNPPLSFKDLLQKDEQRLQDPL